MPAIVAIRETYANKHGASLPFAGMAFSYLCMPAMTGPMLLIGPLHDRGHGPLLQNLCRQSSLGSCRSRPRRRLWPSELNICQQTRRMISFAGMAFSYLCMPAMTAPMLLIGPLYDRGQCPPPKDVL